VRYTGQGSITAEDNDKVATDEIGPTNPFPCSDVDSKSTSLLTAELKFGSDNVEARIMHSFEILLVHNQNV
jgi:hypothetical protein